MTVLRGVDRLTSMRSILAARGRGIFKPIGKEDSYGEGNCGEDGRRDRRGLRGLRDRDADQQVVEGAAVAAGVSGDAADAEGVEGAAGERVPGVGLGRAPSGAVLAVVRAPGSVREEP